MFMENSSLQNSPQRKAPAFAKIELKGKSDFNTIQSCGDFDNLLNLFNSRLKQEIVAMLSSDNNDSYIKDIFIEESDIWLRLSAVPAEEKNSYNINITDISDIMLNMAEMEGYKSVNLEILFTANSAGNILTYNEAWLTTFGYNHKDLKGKRYIDFIHQSNIESTIKEIIKLRSTGEVLNFINLFRCKNGDYKHIEWRAKKIGRTIYASARDITGKVMGESKLKEREQNFVSFFESVDDIIIIADFSGNIIHCNQSAVNKTGYSYEELTSKKILDLHHPSKRDIVTQIVSDMVEGKEEKCPIPLLTSTGNLLPVETRVWIGQWNGNDTLFGISKDLSKESEALEKFNKMFESNPSLMAVSELPSMKFTEVNRAFIEKSGYTQNEIIGKTAKDLDLFIDHTQQEFAAKELIDRGSIEDIDLKIKTKTGKILDGLFSGTLFDSGGKRYLLTVMTDITAQKTIERELNKSREQYILAVTGTNDGIWDWNIKDKTIFLSPRWKEILGYTNEELPNNFETFERLLHEDDRRRVFENIDNYLAGSAKEYSQEFRMTHKEGYSIWVSSKGQAYRDENGTPYRMAGLHSDITERKNTEEALINQAELQNILMDISSKYINISSSQMEEAINESLEQLTLYVGADRAYIFDYDFKNGVCNNTYEWCAPDVIPQIEELQNIPVEAMTEWVTTHKKGESLYIYDVLALDKDDPVRAILEPQQIKSLITIPLMENETCVGFVGFDFVKKNRNYSDKEEVLLRVFAQMLVNVTTRSKLEKKLLLEKANAEIANKAKSEFLANMSHEIRTPLNGVIGFTELLKSSPLSPVQQQYVENANISAHSLLGIINDILDFSKIEAGKLDLEIIMTDIIELVEQSSDIIKFQSSKKDIELLLNIDPNLPRFALVDPIRLKQIIINLLSNAVKFTEEGEIEIKVAFNQIDSKTGDFIFSVRDTGIGISEEQKGKLFKAFSQADSSTTRKFGGTGLGLVISNLLAEKMGSRIELESIQGEGSTFYFSITTNYELGQKLDHTSLNEIERVLVIDDNDNNRMILEHTLKNWNIDFTGCDNGFNALKIIERSRPFDVLIVDYHMPYLNGLDTIKMIREKLGLTPDKQHIILLHSSSDDITIHEECKRLGVRFNLIKPVKSQELIHYLKNLNNTTISNESTSGQTFRSGAQKIKSSFRHTILIVEDVELNMILAKTIIKQIIPNVEILEAKNGKIAVDIASTHNISLILMDVQMPEMNGLEATIKIREIERSKGIKTPIIALSAGVVKGEKEKCFEAGMDAFLPKPISVNELTEVFEQYLSKSEDSNDEFIDLSEININEHFNKDSLFTKLGRDQKLFDEIMTSARIDIQKDIDEIIKNCKESNIEEIKNLAHSIKGVALTLSFDLMGSLAKELEMAAAADSDSDIIKEKTNSLVKEWNIIKRVIL